MKRIRVLVVDDSAFTRKVLREILEASPEIEVIGVARDGLEALEKAVELAPDVMILDLVMPNLDGIGVLRALPKTHRSPRVLVVSTSDADSDIGAEALQLGAVDLLKKPTALATDKLFELAETLLEKVRTAAGARWAEDKAAPALAISRDLARMTRDIVVIGTSTGGPQAITRLLTALPADLPVPIAIALHIPVGYTEALALRLDGACKIEVREASEGLVLTPGMAVLARGGTHLRVVRGPDGLPVARLDEMSLHRGSPYVPSVDVLFESAAVAFESRVLGVVLTGMGNDGLRGSRAIDAADGVVVNEAESSCVVYGMPRCVKEAGLSRTEAPLDQLPQVILRHLTS